MLKRAFSGYLWNFFIDLFGKNAIIIIAFSFLPLLFSSFSPPSAKSRGLYAIAAKDELSPTKRDGIFNNQFPQVRPNRSASS